MACLRTPRSCRLLKVGALIHPDDLRRLEEEFGRAVGKQRREIVSEFRIARANDCENRWIETRNVISYDDAARPLRMTGVSIDVSERKQSENHKKKKCRALTE